jgi:hypothetical protein
MIGNIVYHVLFFFSYSRTKRQDRYLGFDPRPSDCQAVDTDGFLRDLQSLPKPTMWEQLLFFSYKDYELEASRRIVLHLQVAALMANMKDILCWAPNSALSTSCGLHVDGTEEQSECKLWHELRGLRVTGSTFKDVALKPERVAAKLWKEKADLSRVKSIRWGRDKESVGREEYEKKTGAKVTTCGLFVSKENPLFGASPDGLVQDCHGKRGVLEVKCPFSLREHDLTKIQKSNLPSSNFLCLTDKILSLKRTHSYFFQIQLAMYVTGLDFTDFVV